MSLAPMEMRRQTLDCQLRVKVVFIGKKAYGPKQSRRHGFWLCLNPKFGPPFLAAGIFNVNFGVIPVFVLF
jgi:hypothetical protein